MPHLKLLYRCALELRLVNGGLWPSDYVLSVLLYSDIVLMIVLFQRTFYINVYLINTLMNMTLSSSLGRLGLNYVHDFGRLNKL